MHDIIRNEQRIGCFDLTPLPGNSKVCVSHGLEIFEQFRGQGHGHSAQQERLALAKKLGFKIILATVKSVNKQQEKILTKAGWRRATFYENETYNIELWFRNLCDPYEDAQGPNMGCR